VGQDGARSGSLAAVGRATLVLTGGAVLVQGIGFARQMFLAAEVGIASELDALLIALAVPFALVAVLSVGVTTAIVPAYAKAKADLGVVAARRLVGTVLFWLGLAGLALSIGLWLFADVVVALAAPGLAEAGTAAEAVGYLRQVAPLGLIATLSAVLYAACQAERLFLPMTVATVAYPLLALGFLVSFWDTLALDGLAIGTLVGSSAGLAILAGALLARRLYPLPGILPRGLGFRGLAHHAAPLTVSSAIGHANLILDTAITTLVLPGGVSALRYGNSVVRLPFGAIRPAYRTAIYPALVETTNEPSSTGLGATTERVLRYGLVFFVPLAGLTIAVAPLATAILYDHGSFSQSDLMLTALVVAVSAPLIVTWTAHPTIDSALNARRKGMILLAGGIMTMVTNLSLDILLGYLFGLIGIAIATTIASTLVLFVQGYLLSRLEPALSLAAVWRTFLKATLAIAPSTIVFAIPIWAGAVPDDLVIRVVVLVVVGVTGLTSYYALARRTGLQEAASITSFGTNVLRRSYRRLLALGREPA
jgi:putative peptidoglycan lipid II flippase